MIDSDKSGAAFLRTILVCIVLQSCFVSLAHADGVDLDGTSWSSRASDAVVQFEQQGNRVTGTLRSVPEDWDSKSHDAIGDIVYEGTLSGSRLEGSYFTRPKLAADHGCPERYRMEMAFHLTLEKTAEGESLRGAIRGVGLSAGCEVTQGDEIPVVLWRTLGMITRH